MDDPLDALHALPHEVEVAHVADDGVDLPPFGVVEVRDVDDANLRLAVFEQPPVIRIQPLSISFPREKIPSIIPLKPCSGQMAPYR